MYKESLTAVLSCWSIVNTQLQEFAGLASCLLEIFDNFHSASSRRTICLLNFIYEQRLKSISYVVGLRVQPSPSDFRRCNLRLVGSKSQVLCTPSEYPLYVSIVTLRRNSRLQLLWNSVLSTLRRTFTSTSICYQYQQQLQNGTVILLLYL